MVARPVSILHAAGVVTPRSGLKSTYAADQDQQNEQITTLDNCARLQDRKIPAKGQPLSTLCLLHGKAV
jgi:hypothetical protein